MEDPPQRISIERNNLPDLRVVGLAGRFGAYRGHGWAVGGVCVCGGCCVVRDKLDRVGVSIDRARATGVCDARDQAKP